MILKVLKGLLGIESTKDIVKEIRDSVKGEGLSEGLGEALESSGSLNLLNIFFKDGALENARSAFKDTMDAMKIDGGDAFTALTNSSASFFSTLSSGLTLFGQFAIAAGVIAATVGIVDLLTVSYDEARESMDEASSSYQETANEVESLRSELEATEARVKELKDIQANGGLSFVEEEELSRLEQQNELLNRRLEIEEKLANIKAKEQAEATKEVLDYKSEQIYDYNEDGTIKEHKDGTFVTKQVNRFDYLDEQIRLYEQARNNVEKAKYSLTKAKEDYSNGIIDEDTYKQFEINLENNEKAVVNYEKNISSTLDDLGSDISNLYDVNGNVIAGYEDYVDRYNEVNDAFNNIDLSPAQKEYKKVAKFFSSSTGKIIKKSLEDASDSTEELEDKLNSMGLTIEDIGVDSIYNLKRYFDDTKSSVSDAKDEIEDFKVSIADVEAAFESENRGKDYENMVARLKEANELYKNGLIGTDEFQTTTKWLMPKKVSTKGYDNDAVAYKEAWEKAYKKVKTWFDEENPVKSMWNFTDDLYESNSKLFKDYDKTKGRIEFSKEFKSTAQAAKELEVSVDVVDTMFKRLEDYGFQFGDDFKYSGEMLDNFKSNLDGVTATYEELNEGASKDRLKGLIDQWNEDYEVFNSGLTEDINKLSEEQIIKIKFEYDLATIQSQIDKIKSLIEGGDDTSANYAAVISGNEQYISTAEKGVGFDKKGVKIPVEYTVHKDAIEELKSQINKATSEEDKIKIQAEIENLQDLQKSLLNAFSDAHPEINAESSKKEIQKAWDEFVKSVEGKEIIANLTAEDEEAKKTIESILNGTYETTVEVNAEDNATPVIEEISESEMEEKIVQLTGVDNATPYITLWNIMEADPKFAELSAEDQATLVVDTYNKLPLEDKESLISQKGGEVTKGVADEVNRAISLIPNNKTVIIGANLTEKFKNAMSLLRSTSGKISVVKEFATGTMLSPAHADGTAYNVINTRPISSYAQGKVSLPKDETALVNELGTESLIRDGKWMLIPGGMHMEALKKGDIVINAEQTRDLIKHGKTAGHVRALASGTLGGKTLSNAYANPTVYLPTKDNKYTYGNKNNSSNKSGKSNNKNKSNAKDEAEKIDWIVRKINSVQRAIENLEKSVSSTWKTWGQRNFDLSSQLDLITEQIKIQEKAAKRYEKEANKIKFTKSEKKYKDKVLNGEISIESIKDEKLRNKIQEYQEWIDKAHEAEDAIIDLQSERAAKAVEQFELVITQFENELSLIEHETSTIENMIDNTEARGYMVSSSMYDELAKSQEKELDKLQAERDALQSAFDTAVKEGRIEKYSEEWYSMYSQILDVDSAIQDMNLSLIETANAAREADWALFDKTQEIIGELQEESDWLIDLMSSKDMFNDDGSITDEGKATLGLHATNYDAYMSQAKDYAKELEKINEDIAKDPNNTILLDRRKELIDSYRDMISAAEDEKQAIKDIVSEGFDMYLDSMNKLIDKRKEYLQTTKDLYDYEKNIKDQVAEIAKLEKQLAVYSGDTSEESRAKIQQTEEELRKAREELEETEYDKYIQDQEQMLDKLSEDTQEWIDGRLDDIDGLLQGVIDAVNSDSETIKTTLENLLSGYGAGLSENMSNTFTPEDSNVTAYKTGGLVDKTGLAWLDGTKNKPELVLNARDTSNFVELKDALRQLSDADMSAFRDSLSMMNLLADGISSMTNVTQLVPNTNRSQNITVEIGDIQMYGVNDPETFAIQLKDALQNNRAITKIIQADTLGIMTGKNSLSKFKY